MVGKFFIDVFKTTRRRSSALLPSSFFLLPSRLPSSLTHAHRAFTIIELLVASLLLGMLVTILTMVFNQSSIAWRTGTAGVADLDDIRDNVAELREEADNAFVANVGGSYQIFRHVGLWDSRGKLRDRACDAPGSDVMSEGSGKLRANILRQNLSVSASTKPENFLPFNVGNAGNPRSVRNYTVNVMSAGPDKTFDTWDDIWSWPDDFE